MIATTQDRGRLVNLSLAADSTSWILKCHYESYVASGQILVNQQCGEVAWDGDKLLSPPPVDRKKYTSITRETIHMQIYNEQWEPKIQKGACG